jgi:hypothetical protein
MLLRSVSYLSLFIFLSVLSSFPRVASAQTPFNNISVTFNEAGFPTTNTLTAGPGATTNANYDVFDAVGAKGQDAANDLLTTFSASGAQPLSTGATPKLEWQTTSTGRFTSSRDFKSPVVSNNAGTRVLTTLRMLFDSHLTITNLSTVFSSLNTAGTAWEFSTIAFLQPDGSYFTPTPALPLYNAATSFTGSPSQGWFVAADKATVANVGSANTLPNATGTADAPGFVLDYTKIGLAPGTQIGGFEWTTFLEDTRGTSNGQTTFTSSLTDMTLSGTIAATPEPGTLVLLLAPIVLGLHRRKS